MNELDAGRDRTTPADDDEEGVGGKQGGAEEEGFSVKAIPADNVESFP